MEVNNNYEPTQEKFINPKKEEIDWFKSNISTFNLLKSTLYIPKDMNINIDISKMKEYDKPHNIVAKNNYSNNKIYESKEISFLKKIFVKDSFYNRILSTNDKQINFEKMYNDKNFKMLNNEDKSKSSVYFHYPIICQLEKNLELKKIEENLNTVIYNSLKNYEQKNLSIITNPYKCKGISDAVQFYRKVKADGNSFYISFMYQYFKHLIITNNETAISYIFNIDKELNLLNNNENNIDNGFTLGISYINGSVNKEINNYQSAFFYLNMIYKKVIDKKIDEAINILDYSFSYEDSFVLILCMYMRLRIKRFIMYNIDIFTYEIYFKKYNLISEEYFDGKDKKFLYENYINENVVVNQMEPSLFIISIVPYIFNINLNLYINEQGTLGQIDVPFCHKIILNLGHSMINILYTSFSYHIIENEVNNDSINNTLD